MRNTAALRSEALQHREDTPSIRHIFSSLYSRVTAPNYMHDGNPWSDSDPGLQSISTASLELLQDHADFHMQAFLYVHELLDKELVDRKLASRTRLDRASKLTTLPKGSNLTEILFDVEDLEPLDNFLGLGNNNEDPHGTMAEERIEAMAKMAYAWVDGDRSTSARRRRAQSKLTPIKSQAPRNTTVETRNGIRDDGETDNDEDCVADVTELEAQMDELDQVDDIESLSELENSNNR